jgi:hypothetical protein
MTHNTRGFIFFGSLIVLVIGFFLAAIHHDRLEWDAKRKRLSALSHEELTRECMIQMAIGSSRSRHLYSSCCC